MVSEKAIVVLLILAIVFSVISMVLTLSLDIESIRNMPIPNVKPKTSDTQAAQVAIIVNPPPTG